MSSPSQPWKHSDATLIIRAIASNPLCTFSYTKHVKERLVERGLIMSDLLFVLKNGFVYEAPLQSDESTIKGHFKYKIECQTPNSGSRTLRAVVIPDEKSCQIKSITIMWRDEA